MFNKRVKSHSISFFNYKYKQIHKRAFYSYKLVIFKKYEILVKCIAMVKFPANGN